MKPNNKKEIGHLRVQEELDQLKSDIRQSIDLRTVHAVDKIETSLEDMERSVEARPNLEDLVASESIRVPAVLRFLKAMAEIGQDVLVSFDGSGQPLRQEGTRINNLAHIMN